MQFLLCVPCLVFLRQDLSPSVQVQSRRRQVRSLFQLLAAAPSNLASCHRDPIEVQKCSVQFLLCVPWLVFLRQDLSPSVPVQSRTRQVRSLFQLLAAKAVASCACSVVSLRPNRSPKMLMPVTKVFNKVRSSTWKAFNEQVPEALVGVILVGLLLHFCSFFLPPNPVE